MYNLPYFKENDLAVVKQFMRAHPFVFLSGVDVNNQPVASQVPVLIEERDNQVFLMGHMMRKTDHQLAFEKNANALVVFTGPHTYVSASWYTNKQTGATWNYMSVHAKGLLSFLDDNALLNILTRTTALFENNPDSPSLVEKMPQEYLDKMMKAIVGFEIEITYLDNVFKLSQNRDKESYLTITQKLQDQGGDAAAIAAEMQQRRSQLFNHQ
jgi:transcriptional regulator